MRRIHSAAVAALLVTSAVPALAAGPSAADKAKASAALVTLSQLNLAVQEDWKFNGGGEVEGKVYVGRDALQTGSASTTQIGFGASNGQGIVTSTYNTVTVGGKSDVGFQIKNQVSGSYGAYVVGNASQEINVQENNATVNIGGNSSGGVKMTTGSTLNVVGSYTNQNGISLSDNNTVFIGGDSTRIQGGNSGINIKVGGNLKSLDLASGTAQIGGTLGANGDSSATKSSLTVLGNISNLQMNDNGLTVKSGASINNISISNASNVYAAGSISVQNNNGGPGAIHANCGAAYAACSPTTAPTSPGVPVVGGISTQTTTMFDNFTTLQTVLQNLSVANGHLGSFSQTNGTQAYTFNSGASTGYTVINVSEAIFNRVEFAYNFANATTPVIINVQNSGACSLTKACSYNLDENFTGNAGQYNRNVIWNFADASSVILQKQFQGTLLAALADVQANVIEGSVVAKNFTMTNEIHLGTYANTNNSIPLLIGVIPEPANWALMISGFGLVGSVVRRRRPSLVIAA